MVGMGSVVTDDVPAHGLVVGNPARLAGAVCRCGEVVARAARRKADSLEVKFGVVAMYSIVASLHLHRGMIPHLAPDLVSALAADREALVELAARLTIDAVERCAESLPQRKRARSQAKPRRR